MALGSGLAVQFATAEEVAWGTAVTPNRFYEITSETLERKNRIIQSDGMGGSVALRPRRGSRRVISGQEGVGTVNMEVATTGFGRWFKHMLWDGTPTVAQQGATAAYLHTYDLGDFDTATPVLPVGLTVQKGVPQTDGTVKPFTFPGSVVTGFDVSISVDQLLQLAVQLDSRTAETSTGLAAAAYTSTKLFHFAQGALKVDAASVAQVLSAAFSVKYDLKTDSYYLGSAGYKAKPVHQGWPDLGGTLTADFVDLTTFHDLFVADTAAELILEFIGDVIASTYYETLRITIPEVRFTGETPKVGGPGVVVQNVPFEGLWDGTLSGMTIEYLTTDTAV